MREGDHVHPAHHLTLTLHPYAVHILHLPSCMCNLRVISSIAKRTEIHRPISRRYSPIPSIALTLSPPLTSLTHSPPDGRVRERRHPLTECYGEVLHFLFTQETVEAVNLSITVNAQDNTARGPSHRPVIHGRRPQFS